MTGPGQDVAGRPALLSRRHLVIGGLFAGVAGLSQARLPVRPAKRTPPGTVEKLMPDRVGPWSFASASGVIVPPPDATADRLYDNIVTRTYTAPNTLPVMLLIAYSNIQDGMLQIHRPQFCYTAGGFRLSPTVNLQVADATGAKHGANAFSAVNADRTEQVLYWTRIGRSFPQSWLEQKASVIDSNLRMRTPDGLLARVSVTETDQTRALATLQAFVGALDRAAGPQLQDILFARHR